MEEALKNEEIDQVTFERLRFEIAGGDLESTHLVKGLDFKLLERVRKGEDVYSGKPEEEEISAEPAIDVDDEFDQLEEQEVRAVEREKADKKGQLSTAPLAQGKKRTRDQILAELKAAREAAKASAEPALSNRFKKIGGKVAAGTRFERDSKGREVMIITDEDGHEKRKVRKLHPGEETAPDMVADPTVAPLGMEVPEQYRTKQAQLEDDDSDIFADAGDDYDPLAGLEGSESDSGDESEDKTTTANTANTANKTTKPTSATATAATASKQNYFQGSKTGLMSEEKQDQPSMSEPAIMAAIKRAAALRSIPGAAGSDSDSDSEANIRKAEQKAREERHRKMLANNDRDAEDMDMGFGTSRFEDEEEFEDSKTKLSNWGDADMTGDNADDNGRGKSKRKRAPKKRKGDVNNADDVLRVMEARKKA